MCLKQITSLLLAMLVESPVLAQESSVKTPDLCKIEPIFHCAEHMDNGTVIGHFGYRRSCPKSDRPIEDAYIRIGDDNSFTPKPIDRGQPKVFVQGDHIDEFEVEFSATEIKKGTKYSWAVLKASAGVNFDRTKDAFLDCTKLSR